MNEPLARKRFVVIIRRRPTVGVDMVLVTVVRGADAVAIIGKHEVEPTSRDVPTFILVKRSVQQENSGHVPTPIRLTEFILVVASHLSGVRCPKCEASLACSVWIFPHLEYYLQTPLFRHRCFPVPQPGTRPHLSFSPKHPCLRYGLIYAN